MTKPTLTIHNIETDEVIERDMTTQEIAQYNADVAAQSERVAANTATAAAKQAILDRLGLTADEAKLLLG